MRVALFGRGGKVGSVLGARAGGAGHELVELGDAEAMVDFTAPEAVEANVLAALEQDVPCVVGTTGWDPAGPAPWRPIGACSSSSRRTSRSARC